MLQKHEKVFGDLPSSRPPNIGVEDNIELEVGTQPIITRPYKHPNGFIDEIERAIKELLELGFIRPSSSPFASSVKW